MVTTGGQYTLNGRGFLAHALEAKLSPLEWAYFAFDPIRDPLELDPGDFVTWPTAAGPVHGWIANFTPETESRFRIRVLAMPPHLRLEAVTAACGNPLPLDGLPVLPSPAKAASSLSDPSEAHGSARDLEPAKAFPAGQGRNYHK